MRKFISWLSSWATTLRIMVFERDTYLLLRDWTDEPGGDEFVEVFRPGGDEE